MAFRNSHKIALVRLLSEFVNADGEVNQNEVFYLRYIDRLYDISAADRKNAFSLSLEEAVERLCQLSVRERFAVLKMIQQLSLSDDDLSTEEAMLLTAVMLALKLPQASLPQARIVTVDLFHKNSEKNVLFAETEYNDLINRQIESDYQRINSKLHEEGFEFFYLPEIMRNLESRRTTFHNTLQYLHPELTSDEILLIDNHLSRMDTMYFTRQMFASPLPVAAFCFQLPDLNGGGPVNYLMLELPVTANPYEILQSFFNLHHHISESVETLFPPEIVSYLSSYERVNAPQVDPAEAFVVYSGFHKIILDTLVKSHANADKGLLYIDAKGKIILHCPQPFEVKMPALSRALYIFFVAHPEGIRLDELKKHRDELLCIYRRISTYKNEELLRQAVIGLTDYTGNTLSSAISRIKKAFTSLVGEDADAYLISGPKSGLKKIDLDRDVFLKSFF